VSTTGYTMIHCKGHPSTNKDGYVAEHRLVMEGRLGRYLESWEVSHHRNEIKTDNNPNNLQLMTNSEHTRHHNTKRRLN